MIQCKKCCKKIDLVAALERSPYSWPQLQTIWHICEKCQEGNHLRFVTGQIQIIKIVGAPGPDWEIIQTQPEPSVSLRVDPEYLHIWYKDKHYEINAKK